MNATSAVDEKIRDNLLSGAVAGNVAAELVVVRGENLQATLHSRFVRSEPERVLLEVPTHSGRPVVLQPGQFVEVYFKLDHERFAFDTRVIGYSRVTFNDDTAVQAVALAPPHFLERRQRRSSYRVSVAALPNMIARVWAAGADTTRCHPIEAKLCNLSAGGAAVLVDRQRWQFASDQQYRIQFSLPAGTAPARTEGPWPEAAPAPADEENEFDFEAVVCHVRHVFHSRRQIVGMAFLPGEDQAAHRQALDRIARFVAAQQREELFQKAHQAGPNDDLGAASTGLAP